MTLKYVNYKYNIWNCGSGPEIKNLGRFGLKIAMCPVFMKVSTQNKLNILVMDLLIGTDNRDPKIQIWANLVPQLKCPSIFMKFDTQHNLKS